MHRFFSRTPHTGEKACEKKNKLAFFADFAQDG
jgi:hypothetical protein